MTADGVVSGTPTNLGSSSFTVVATNGITADAQRTSTLEVIPAPKPPKGLPPPVAGKTFNLEPVDGTTSTKCAGESGFSKLVAPRQVTLHCKIDSSRGTVALTASKGSSGETQTANFWGGLFDVDQKAGDNRAAVLGLKGGLRCERNKNGKRHRVHKRKGKGGRKLWGSGSGNYKTVGSHGSATVRGTIWLVSDRCDHSTFFKVKRGTVVVQRFRQEGQGRPDRRPEVPGKGRCRSSPVAPRSRSSPP